MAYAVDTNILLRAVQPAHPMHEPAVRAVIELLNRGETLCLFPQNIREFWNVCTRPTTSNGLGLTPAQAQAEVTTIEAFLTVLPDSPAIYPEWRRLVAAYSVSGVQVHDAYLVAAMIVHGIDHLLTFNTGDFARYSSIAAVNPQAV